MAPGIPIPDMLLVAIAILRYHSYAEPVMTSPGWSKNVRIEDSESAFLKPFQTGRPSHPLRSRGGRKGPVDQGTSDGGSMGSWPYREQVAVVEGDVVLGGLMMVHERHNDLICGKVMPQGGIQATEAMLFAIDHVNRNQLIPGVRIGARIKDDCDRDIYGLEQSVDFIRGKMLVT